MTVFFMASSLRGFDERGQQDVDVFGTAQKAVEAPRVAAHENVLHAFALKAFQKLEQRIGGCFQTLGRAVQARFRRRAVSILRSSSSRSNAAWVPRETPRGRAACACASIRSRRLPRCHAPTGSRINSDRFFWPTIP